MKNRKAIALEVIEALTCEDWVEESLQKRMIDIYKYSHCVLGNCENPHKDWLEELYDTYLKLKKANVL